MTDNLMITEVESLEWFHPNANRHIAESVLMQNADEGTYLLRPSSENGKLVLSIMCKSSVKHIPIECDGSSYKFGQGTFHSLSEFTEHFMNQPLLSTEAGNLTVLKFPYPRDVEEPSLYDRVKIHAECGTSRIAHKAPHLAIGSKEGFLTKRGGKMKNWKTRWFTIVKNEMKYFRERTDKDPVRTIDLDECQECEQEASMSKDNCFRLVFPWRTFYLYASTEQEMKEWMDIIQWKLDNTRPPIFPGVGTL